MNEFYVLGPVDDYFSTRWAYGTDVNPRRTFGEPVYCPECHRRANQGYWIPPHQVKLSSANPKKWGEFLWIDGGTLAVTKRFREIYENEGLTGIESFSEPIQIARYGTKKTGEFPVPPPEYSLIYIPWDGPNQDDQASGVSYDLEKDDHYCPYCRRGVFHWSQPRIILDEGTWKGEDIFRPRGAPVPYMVSERFKQVCDQYELTNIWVIPARVFGWNEHHPGLWFINKDEPGGEEISRRFIRSGLPR